jgi:hypothetical protein
MSVATSRSGATGAICPFRLEIEEEQLTDLFRRLDPTRWPSKELVADRSQGVQLATIQELVRYWVTDYDWHQCQARLNALAQFKTEIGGVDIHFPARAVRTRTCRGGGGRPSGRLSMTSHRACS